MKTSIVLAVLSMSILVFSLVVSFNREYVRVDKKEIIPAETGWYVPKVECVSIMPEPEPVVEPTRAELDPFPTEVHLRVIGRMAKNLTELKMKAGGWWECGIFYTDEKEIYNKALKYAYMIVRKSWEHSDPPYNEKPWILNPWGLAGTIWNESKFDRCAFGLWPRLRAYELKLLKRNKLTLSHKEEDVLAAIRDPRMQKQYACSKCTGFDLGLAQLLSRFYINPTDYEHMLTLEGGTEEAARTMHIRSRWGNSKVPWAYWPGHYSEKYEGKVTRWGRMLGATRDEIKLTKHK